MTEAGGERHRQDRPRIYVASLSDYNAGRLHGVWLDADQDAVQLAEEVHGMLASSPEPFAEEYAIHDYEGFGRVQIGEYESLARVAALARGIVEHGEAFAAWASLDSSTDPSLDRFEEAFRGTWASVEDYAEELLADLGAAEFLSIVPDWLDPYVRLDSKAFARDLLLSGDIAAIEGDSGVHIFEQSV
jgi:antirestriction protein